MSSHPLPRSGIFYGPPPQDPSRRRAAARTFPGRRSEKRTLPRPRVRTNRCLSCFTNRIQPDLGNLRTTMSGSRSCKPSSPSGSRPNPRDSARTATEDVNCIVLSTTIGSKGNLRNTVYTIVAVIQILQVQCPNLKGLVQVFSSTRFVLY